eukprot:11171062-Lingulodinium_polyedra.AAC.1
MQCRISPRFPTRRWGRSAEQYEKMTHIGCPNRFGIEHFGRDKRSRKPFPGGLKGWGMSESDHAQ